MRALIRDVRTGRFYAPDSNWTPKREDAYDFGNSERASAFVMDNHLRGVEVVLASDNPEQDRTVSVELETRPPNTS
jgi:hypothetical protein